MDWCCTMTLSFTKPEMTSIYQLWGRLMHGILKRATAYLHDALAEHMPIGILHKQTKDKAILRAQCYKIQTQFCLVGALILKFKIPSMKAV